MNKADEIIETAKNIVSGHAEDRDKGEERSMKKIVEVFNALTEHTLSEEDGNIFMVVLKLVRAQRSFNIDNYVDGIGYLSLAGEVSNKSGDNL